MAATMTSPADAQEFGGQLLALDLTDDFTVGHDAADRQFGLIAGMVSVGQFRVRAETIPGESDIRTKGMDLVAGYAS